MRALVQRSLESSVTVDNKVVGKINKGMVVLVGFTYEDNDSDIDYLVRKIINLRIFEDENGIMNKSILETNGEILLISQFTLYADTTGGNRPSYIKALKSEEAKSLYEKFIEKLRNHIYVETGVFGADMKVNILNDGPVTIMLESKGK